jgi:hypothetical protein
MKTPHFPRGGDVSKKKFFFFKKLIKSKGLKKSKKANIRGKYVPTEVPLKRFCSPYECYSIHAYRPNQRCPYEKQTPKGFSIFNEKAQNSRKWTFAGFVLGQFLSSGAQIWLKRKLEVRGIRLRYYQVRYLVT